MKGFSIFLIYFYNCLQANCQILNGVITRMNSGNKGIAGIEITSLGANPAISENDGHFKLIYQNKKIGSGVGLQIEKEGFEVVNNDALFTYLGNQYDTLKIYLCRKGEIDSLRILYYDISVNNIRKHYETEIAKLKAKNKEDLNQISILNQELKAALIQAEDLARRFSVINLDNCSELFRNAFHLFEQGKIEEAINSLPDSVIEKQINECNLQIEEAEMMDSIAAEKRGKAMDLINMIRNGRSLTKTIMDSLQNQTITLLQKTNPEISILAHHADILFCLREWEMAAQFYKKVLASNFDSKKKHVYRERLVHCQQAKFKH